jgi:hypothetical protein
MAATRAELRTEATQRANQENKTLVGADEWNRYINLAIGELYDLVISANPHYYIRSQAFTLTSSNLFDLTTLTGGFYKLRGVDYMVTSGSRPIALRPFNFAERNKQGYRAYSIEGTNLMIQPGHQASIYAGNYMLWYTPTPPVLTADSGANGTLDSILDVWAEFITVTAALMATIKAEDESAALAAIKNGIIARIREASQNRDGQPPQAADLTMIRSDDYDLWWP